MSKKRAKPVSTKKFTLERCRKNGWLPADCERRLPFFGGKRATKRRATTVDLFGFADVIALQPAVPGVLLIQCTSFGSRLARVKKILETTEYEARLALECGNRIEVWGWRRRLEGKRTRWRVTIIHILLDSGELVRYDAHKDI